jgi:predicted nucleic acid-binding protein
VRLVIADTGPINYLILIGYVDLLPRLFERVALPSAVQVELSTSRAPLPVQLWIQSPPAWLEIFDTTGLSLVSGLDAGETAAIALAESLHAELLLMDEREGSRVARDRGLRVTGTLGLLDLAAERGLVDFYQAIKELEHHPAYAQHFGHVLAALALFDQLAGVLERSGVSWGLRPNFTPRFRAGSPRRGCVRLSGCVQARTVLRSFTAWFSLRGLSMWWWLWPW